ncbi:MAG: hypothetical protein PHF86_15210 [Candidatus Nanoarchaeia archaeon]|nr:hypothetical protein [Candidatus Nanoarchaeia archaeon]
MDNLKIKQILVDGRGFIYAEGDISSGISHCILEWFEVNGEMARVKWIRATYPDGTVKEFNGKYIIEVEYYPLKAKE